MKKLLIIAGCIALVSVYGCDDKTSEKAATPTASGSSDTMKVTAMNSAAARAMIQHFKSPQAAPFRERLFRGGVNVARLTSIINGATKFNIFAAAYPNDYVDHGKRNMPTFILQVLKSSSASTDSSATTVEYYLVDDESLCPPPPDCNTVIIESES